MSAGIYIAIAAVFLGACFVAAILMVTRRRGARCSRCGQRLPRRTSHCPVCDVEQADGRRPPPMRDIAPDEPLGELHLARGAVGSAAADPPKPSPEDRALPDDVQRAYGLSSGREPAYPAGGPAYPAGEPAYPAGEPAYPAGGVGSRVASNCCPGGK